jgi:hypothetical protein
MEHTLMSKCYSEGERPPTGPTGLGAGGPAEHATEKNNHGISSNSQIIF